MAQRCLRRLTGLGPCLESGEGPLCWLLPYLSMLRRLAVHGDCAAVSEMRPCPLPLWDAAQGPAISPVNALPLCPTCRRPGAAEGPLRSRSRVSSVQVLAPLPRRAPLGRLGSLGSCWRSAGRSRRLRGLLPCLRPRQAQQRPRALTGLRTAQLPGLLPAHAISKLIDIPFEPFSP